ncbi:hypothetical protein B0H17DRAFT_934292 [Mycena rosella]|uniref:Uncharacterized protein n=1 Tax=Mycena rosella TaxID=1033263 RepID=A0AAD7DII4_MYCRO|nr:hypothetical protein B0H17DRAFT_934292 [Mycena rosella]
MVTRAGARDAEVADDLDTQVMWRASEDPFWTEVVPVGKVMSATVRLSKDNTRCGVRAWRGELFSICIILYCSLCLSMLRISTLQRVRHHQDTHQ